MTKAGGACLGSPMDMAMCGSAGGRRDAGLQPRESFEGIGGE